MRHILFNSNATATAVLLVLLSIVAVLSGFYYDWKSAWCAGMCPVHQVEKLYGTQGIKPFLNAHCGQCHNCSIPCPDSSSMSFSANKQSCSYGSRYTWLFCGGFPGFIWGWFQVPDYEAISSLYQLAYTYAFPSLGFLISLMIFWICSKILSGYAGRFLIKTFTALAVSMYYWYRIPALVGFGVYPGDGMLYDLTGVMPSFVPTLIALVVSVFFFWWFLGRRDRKHTWLIRPEYARK